MNSYIFLSIYGRSIDKFLKKCKKNNINILNIKSISHKEIIIKINIDDFQKIKKIKSIYKIKIITTGGLIKYKKIIYKNKIFIFEFILGIIFLILLTNIIFSINVVSDNKSLNKKIIKELEIYGIKKYNFKKSYKKIQKIKRKIIKKYKNEIQWLEIINNGTNYEVKIVERKKNKKEKNIKYSNIVAKKSGVVKKIIIQDGQKILDVDNYVNKGDILISGIIYKGEEEKHYLRAKGKVYAEIWYNVSIEFPLEYIEKKYTNKTKKSLYIKLNDRYYEFKNFKNYERKTIKSLSNNLIPFEIGIENQSEIKIINDKYSYEEAKNKALLKAKEKILLSLDKDEFIIEENILKFIKKNSKIELEIFFSCFEEISKEEVFDINKKE